MPNGWVKCPRCELNYIREGEEYCEVCKAELRKGPELIFAIDDEDVEETMDLCPRCHHNYIKDGESMCEECRKELEREPDEADDETWKEYRLGMRFAFRRDLIRDFDDSVISLKAFAKGNSYGDFLESFETSVEFLDEMERNNNFDLSVR